jgi:hypothetical protein
VYTALVRTPEGKRSLRIPQCKRDDSVKFNLGGVRWDVMDRIDMLQDMDKVTGSFKHGNGPSGFTELWELFSFFRRIMLYGGS